jgi:hypothetical protein
MRQAWYHDALVQDRFEPVLDLDWYSVSKLYKDQSVAPD